VKNLSDIEDAECRMLVVDQLLEELGLAAWTPFTAIWHYKREETDSIAIIDDIRSHITSKVKNLSDIEDAECRMLVVDQLLEELGLVA